MSDQQTLFQTVNGHVRDSTTDGPGWRVLDHEPIPERRGRQGFQGDRTYPCWRVSYTGKGSAPYRGFIGRFPDRERAETHIRMLAYHAFGTLKDVKIECERRTEVMEADDAA